MLYRPINSREDFESLIQIDKTSESIHWDYKQQFNDEKKSDIAIDLAAFANTLGGTLLIGVSEKNIDGRKVANSLFNVDDFEKIRARVFPFKTSLYFSLSSFILSARLIICRSSYLL